MSGFVVFLLIALVTFAAVVWPTRKAAQLVGADNTGYGTVILALVLSFIVLLGLGFLLGALAQNLGGAISAGLLLAAAVVYLYSKVFGTGMLGGFLIWLIANVIGALVSLVLATVLGIGGSLFGGADISRVTAAVDDTCECDGEDACVQMQMAVFEGEMEKLFATQTPDRETMAQVNDEVKRLESCLAEMGEVAPAPSGRERANTGATRAAPATPPEATTEPEAKPEAATKPRPAPLAKRVVYVWQDSDLDELPARIGDGVRFELNDGRVREGILISVTAEGASVQSARSRGLTYEVNFESVKSVQVYTRTMQ